MSTGEWKVRWYCNTTIYAQVRAVPVASVCHSSNTPHQPNLVSFHTVLFLYASRSAASWYTYRMTPPTLDLGMLPVSSVLWIVFALACIGFCVFSAIMLWHWREYSTGRFTTAANMAVYFGVGVALLGTMALAALWYGV